MAELDRRYVRCPDMFHDVPGTIRQRDGQFVYTRAEVSWRNDAVLLRGTEPLLETWLTPGAVRTLP